MKNACAGTPPSLSVPGDALERRASTRAVSGCSPMQRHARNRSGVASVGQRLSGVGSQPDVDPPLTRHGSPQRNGHQGRRRASWQGNAPGVCRTAPEHRGQPSKRASLPKTFTLQDDEQQPAGLAADRLLDILERRATRGRSNRRRALACCPAVASWAAMVARG